MARSEDSAVREIPSVVGTPARLLRATGLVSALFLAGTVGYRVVEGAPVWDSFYMTVITITTVGFAEQFPLSPAGEVLTAVLLVAGLGIFSFWRPRSVGQSWKGSCSATWGAYGGLA